MATPAVKIAVVLGMAATLVSFFPLLKLLVGHCFFEQGCGKYENLQMLGVVLASCLIGLLTAWVVARVVGRWQPRA